MQDSSSLDSGTSAPSSSSLDSRSLQLKELFCFHHIEWYKQDRNGRKVRMSSSSLFFFLNPSIFFLISFLYPCVTNINLSCSSFCSTSSSSRNSIGSVFSFFRFGFHLGSISCSFVGFFSPSSFSSFFSLLPTSLSLQRSLLSFFHSSEFVLKQETLTLLP
jgi:hypothetical protein